MSENFGVGAGASDARAAQTQALLTALKRVTEHMDRAGGDGYGMPECPWCRCQYEGDVQHLPDCELLLARQVIADIEAGIGAAVTPQGDARPTRYFVKESVAARRGRTNDAAGRWEGIYLRKDEIVYLASDVDALLRGVPQGAPPPDRETGK